MNRQHIARLEEQLESLIETAFSSLMGNRLRAQDLALHLARAMEDHAVTIQSTDPRPIAPDTYQIVLRDDLFKRLVSRNPQLNVQLAEHMIELANQAGFRLDTTPTVKLIADVKLITHFKITASHSEDYEGNRTDAMQRVEVPANQAMPHAHFLTTDYQAIPLEQDIMNLGRHKDNHIVLDDPAVSRYHAQVRRRYGEHMIFCVNSKNGMYVNDVRVKEHHLKPGDVVQLGGTRLIYTVEDNDDDTTHPADTGILKPL